MTSMTGDTRYGHIKSLVYTWLTVMLSVDLAQAATVNYILDNVIQDNAQQMTGSFQWTYDEGDFENGSGLFSELFIPGHGTDIDALKINFDVANSIEFSLIGNFHGGGVNVTLFLLQPLSLSQPASIDLGLSSYEIESGVQNGGFISGSIVPSAIPVPAAAWLFGTGLIGLSGMLRRRKIT